MEVNGAPKQPDYKLSSKHLPLCFSRTKKFIQVWNYLRVSKWWQNFHFWVNNPFKVCILWSSLQIFNYSYPHLHSTVTVLILVCSRLKIRRATKKLWRCISSLQNQSQNLNSPKTCSVLLLILQALLFFLQEMQINFKNRVWNRAHYAMINVSNGRTLYCCHMTSSHACLIQLEVFSYRLGNKKENCCFAF